MANDDFDLRHRIVHSPDPGYGPMKVYDENGEEYVLGIDPAAPSPRELRRAEYESAFWRYLYWAAIFGVGFIAGAVSQGVTKP